MLSRKYYEKQLKQCKKALAKADKDTEYLGHNKCYWEIHIVEYESALTLYARNDRLTAMVKRIEWLETEYFDKVCPDCGMSEPGGHAPDCELAKLLEGSGE